MAAERIRTFEALDGLAKVDARALVLASGSLSSVYLLRWMAQRFRTVTALHVRLDPEAAIPEPLPTLCQALSVELHSVDATVDFSERYIIPAIRAQARFRDSAPLSHSLWQALVAEQAATLARKQGFRVLVHAALPGRYSLERINTSLAALGFVGAYGSPFDETVISHEMKQGTLQEMGLLSRSPTGPRVRENPWSRTLEAGELGDDASPGWKDGAFAWTRATREQPMRIRIGFERGAPRLLEGRLLNLKAVLSTLNRQVGAYGLGRFLHLDTSEDVRVDQVHEAPGATLLLDAYKRLEAQCLSAEFLRTKQPLEELWAREAMVGRWFALPRRSAEAFISTLAEAVVGEVEYELSRAGFRPVRIQPKK